MAKWTYDYLDRPRPCYRIQDGSDDGDVAECWDQDVAKAIVKAMNERGQGLGATEKVPLTEKRGRTRRERK